MVFWPWITRNTPENTVARQYNSKHIKWRQPKKNIRNEQPTLENEYATVPSNPTQTLSQEQPTNLENLKRIMNSAKTTLLSLRNIKWRTLKTETNKINQIQPYISTNNITELNDLIYAEAKLVWEKWGLLKKHEQTVETRMGSSIGNPDKKSTKTGQNGNTERSWNMWE